MPEEKTNPRSQPSLDEIVAQNAAVVADQIQKAAAKLWGITMTN
jgi:hypothetical protein